MQTIKVISLIGLIAMAGIILYAFVVGDFFSEGKALLAMPWGIVSMVDLYVGFTVFSCWIAYRENSCLLYTSPSPRDRTRSRMPSSA